MSTLGMDCKHLSMAGLAPSCKCRLRPGKPTYQRSAASQTDCRKHRRIWCWKSWKTRIFWFPVDGWKAHERNIERELVRHITEFLVELGSGFSYVGKEVHLEVEGEDFYLDLLFHHLKLRRFVVIELKAGAFKPKYAGKLNFYCSAVDDLLRHENDKPTIGLILCKKMALWQNMPCVIWQNHWPYLTICSFVPFQRIWKQVYRQWKKLNGN